MSKDNYKQLLVIAYFFPPLGGVGVQRAVKFVKYLNKFGWISHVIAVGNSSLYPLHDESYFCELPPDGTVTYVDDPRDLAARKIALFLPLQNLVDKIRKKKVNLAAAIRYRLLRSSWFDIPDEACSWIGPAYQAAFEVIKKYDIRVMFSTSAPYSSHLVAYKLKKKLRLAWAADFRDEWIENPYIVYPTRIQMCLNKQWEKRVVESADVVIGVSEPISDLFRKVLGGQTDKVKTITNGFDPEDFVSDGLDRERVEESTNRAFCLGYAGSFYGPYVPNCFFKAIEQMVDSGELTSKDILLKFWGSIDKAVFSNLMERNIIEYLGFVSHQKSIENLRNSDALLFYLPTERGHRAYLGKLFEYLAARRPILALVSDGISLDLIQEAQAGIIVLPEDVEGIKEGMRILFRRWREREEFNPNQEIIQRYDRRRLTGDLAQQLALILEDKVKGGPV
jgi:glycosyltransferase involved in cell wall biosynthesis